MSGTGGVRVCSPRSKGREPHACGSTALLLAAVLWLAPIGTGCGPGRVIRDALKPTTPHESYARALESAGLADTALAVEWRRSALAALAAPAPVPLPFQEDVYVDPAQPRAVAYEVSIRRGQRLEVETVLTGEASGQVFVDVFERTGTSILAERAAASAEPASAGDGPPNSVSVVYEPDADRQVVVRVQPELLRGGRLRTTSRAVALLQFPVPAADVRGLHSVFGDVRDGGRRRHDGVDIFAPRGTPVVSASSGIVSDTGENARGGRVVWVWDGARNQTLYYAHLDERRVSAGQAVRPGDPLGTVGNTGNARSTAPHLHFGIYRGRQGAIDPEPFIRPVPAIPVGPGAPLDRLGEWARITAARTRLRGGPSAAAPVLGTAARHAPAQLQGAIGGWVRVQLPDTLTGFVRLQEVEVSPAPLRTLRVGSSTPLRVRPDTDAPARSVLQPPATVRVIGTFEGHALVEVESGERGWVALQVSLQPSAFQVSAFSYPSNL